MPRQRKVWSCLYHVYLCVHVVCVHRCKFVSNTTLHREAARMHFHIRMCVRIHIRTRLMCILYVCARCIFDDI